MHARGDPFQSRRSVIHGVQTRDVREQRLRRTDIRRRLLTPDMLLARLQRHPIRRIAAAVDRDADDPSRRLADMLLDGREERSVRPAIPEGYTQSLRVPVNDIGAHLTGRGQQHATEQIGADRHHDARLPRSSDEVA